MNSIFDLVRRIDLKPPKAPGFCLLIAEPGRRLIEELRTEIEVQTGESLAVLEAGGFIPQQLLDEFRRVAASVFLLIGLKVWSNEYFSELDRNRSGLEAGRYLIFQADDETAARLLNHAPNLASYFGTNVFRLDVDPSQMTAAEIEAALNQLRARYQRTDDDVVRQAEQGLLPPDPEFAEWLVLLGRGELVRA